MGKPHTVMRKEDYKGQIEKIIRTVHLNQGELNTNERAKAGTKREKLEGLNWATVTQMEE